MSLVLVAASLSNCAPMFWKGSCSSISFATVTPSWVTVGAPHFLSRATLRPLGPRVVLTASARASTPRFRETRASSRNCNCLAGIYWSPPGELTCQLRHDGQDVGHPQDEVLLV